MAAHLQLRFLGTSSAASPSRNVSSMLVRIGQQTVMIDCGDGTHRQLLDRRLGNQDIKLSSLRHILITHLHADHVLGLVPLIMAIMGPPAPDQGGGGVTATTSAEPASRNPRLEIYGPCGLRSLIRTTLMMTYANLSLPYVVHELLWPHEYATDHAQSADAPLPSFNVEHNASGQSSEQFIGAVQGPARCVPVVPPGEMELPGMDFRLDEASATWPDFLQVGGQMVSAAPLLHRCPCIGYVFRELPVATPLDPSIPELINSQADALYKERGIRHPLSLLGRLVKARESVELPDGTLLQPPELYDTGRKMVILGDTFDATGGLADRTVEGPDVDDDGTRSKWLRGMVGLAMDASVLVHESTNIALPASLTSSKSIDSREAVRAKAILRGHSTPQVAGSFAGKIRARHLLMNHFSVRYPAPTDARLLEGADDSGRSHVNVERTAVMQEFEDQATEAWLNALGEHAHEVQPSRAIATYDGCVFDVPPPLQEQIEQAGRSSPLPSSSRNSSALNRHGRAPRGPPRRQGSSATLASQHQDVHEQQDGRSSSMSVGHPYASARRSTRGRGRGQNHDSRRHTRDVFEGHVRDPHN